MNEVFRMIMGNTKTRDIPKGPARRVVLLWRLTLLLFLPLSLLSSCVISETGEGPELGDWQPTQWFAGQRAWHAACVYGGFIYVLGGNGTSGLLNDVQYAGINAYGAVLPWATTTSFPTQCFGHRSVVVNGYIYVTGGETSLGATLDGVRYGFIQPGGSVQSWETEDVYPLPVARSKHASFVYGSKLFVVGGWNGIAPLADVRCAPVSAADGSVSSDWTLSNLAWPLSPPRHSHTSVVHNGYLYVVGGDGGGGPLDTVKYAPITLGGFLSDDWTDATPLPGPRAGHASFVYNGHLYVLGGTSASGVYEDDVFYAKINDDGSLGSWSSTTPLKSAREGLAAVNFGVSVYVLGGLGASTRLNDAWYAQFQ
jgi:hypothetical protein